MRELGAKRKWADVFALVRTVPLEELLPLCKENAHKVAALEAKRGGGNKTQDGAPKVERLQSAFVDVLEAYVTAKHGGIWKILGETCSDPILANGVGVRRLRRACQSLSNSPLEADEKMLRIMSQWLLHAQSFEQRRAFVQVFMRAVNDSDSATSGGGGGGGGGGGSGSGSGSDAKESTMNRGLDAAVQLITELRKAIDEKLAATTTTSMTGRDPPELALGDTALLVYIFWCKLNLPRSLGPKLGRRLFAQLRSEGGAEQRLLQPSYLRPELYALCVHGALGWAGTGGWIKSLGPAAKAGGGETANEGRGAPSLQSGSPKSSPRDKVSDQSNGAQSLSEEDTLSLQALLDLAWDNSPFALVLRAKFFHVLMAPREGGNEQLVLHLARRLQNRHIVDGSVLDAGDASTDGSPQGEKLLLGTGVWNAVAEAHAALGQRLESFDVLDAMNAEKRLPAAREAFRAAQLAANSSSALPAEDRRLVAFGPNVHTYIQLANSHRASTPAVRATRKAQWPRTMQRLFSRMDQDGVVPDVRLLFNMGEAARELGDFDFVTRVIEKAHAIAQVPRKRLGSEAGLGVAAASGVGAGAGAGAEGGGAWQPPTTLPGQFYNPDQQQQQQQQSQIHGRRSDGDDGESLAPKGRQYIPTIEEFSQIYHYGVAVAHKCGRPEDCLVLLLMMVQMDLHISEHTMLNVLRSLVGAGTPVHLEEVIRLFGLMPKWSVKRTEGHAACFVEALAKLGRFGDASLGLEHMFASGKALTPTTYAVVLASLLQTMAEQCPRGGGQSELPQAVGGGKKPLSPAQATELAVVALRRIAKLLSERAGEDGFANDYLLSRAVLDVSRAFSAFEQKAHPDLVCGVWAAFVKSDARLAALFEKRLSRQVQAKIKARLSSK